MSDVRLSEQIGAMALVDELRHRDMALLEHLDLAQRQAEVAERIRAYYSSQGIACSDDLIEQGVTEYFDQRLVFEAPQMSASQHRLAWLISSKTAHRWMLAIWWPFCLYCGYQLLSDMFARIGRLLG